MEPQIRYARTTDGVRIAYAEVGEGPHLVIMGSQASTHAELNWEMYAPLFHPLAARFHTVWFDFRGTGLSDRDAVDFSIEAMVRDLGAVVDRAGLQSFALAGWVSAVPVAVAYATTHAERLSHLILVDGWATYSTWAQAPGVRASIALLETDWVLYTETVAQVVWAYANPEFGRRFAAFLRECAEPEAVRASWGASQSYDVSELLPQVTTPTLVVHNRNNRLIPLSAGQRLAADIPGARLAVIDDIGAYAPLPAIIEEFMSEGEPTIGNSRAHSSAAPPEAGTAIILFTDVVDSTALTERLGDAAFREKARDLDGALRAIIRDNAGTPIEGKLLGDGVLAVFTSARQAIEAALACGKAGTEGGLPLHLGLHAGDVIREEDNVYGGAVNIASRISGLSAPGEVLVSDTVRSLARTSAGVRFEDRGEQSLKGVGELVRVWAVLRRAQDEREGD